MTTTMQGQDSEAEKEAKAEDFHNYMKNVSFHKQQGYGKVEDTPSVARMMNSSLSVRWRYDMSGTEIKPKSFKQKSPKALAIAKPGESLLGNHTRATSGSSCKAKTLPLHC